MERKEGETQMSNVFDGLFAVFAIVALITALLFGMYIMEQVKNVSPYTEVDDAMDEGMNWLVMFDGLTVFIFFSMVLAILILAFILPANTVFAVLMFIVIIIQIPIIDMLKHYINELVAQPEFAGYLVHFPMTFLILENSTLVIMCVAVLTAIIQFGKGHYGQGGRYG